MHIFNSVFGQGQFGITLCWLVTYSEFPHGEENKERQEWGVGEMKN